MTRRMTLVVLAVLMTFGPGGAAWAGNFTGLYDFSDTQYTTDFTGIRRAAQITDDGALDLGGTGHTALNFTGMVGTKGDTWLTKWTPGGSTGPISVFDARCGLIAEATVLTHPRNNRKGAGVVALLNDTNPGDRGLALILYNNGNSDSLQLATIDPATGKLTTLASAPLKGAIKENAWYVVQLELATDEIFGGDPDALVFLGAVFSLNDPENPTSGTDTLLGVVGFIGLTFSGTGLQRTGQVGIVASAINAVVDSSVTNWGAEDNLFLFGGCPF